MDKGGDEGLKQRKHNETGEQALSWCCGVMISRF